MMKTLVIVESPTKAKTISRFLGKDYQVESSNGHVRDLPKGDIGVDVENEFEARYVTPKKKEKHANSLKKIAKDVDKIILATDEDREGEAIAWHLAQSFGLENNSDKLQRIVFHEITKNAIDEAIKHPRAINMDLVEAQQARRIVDRLVGYSLSPFLWKKLMRGLSAGRVQSVALKIIIEREDEIKKFKPVDYWTISGIFSSPNKKDSEFEGVLTKINDKAIEKPGLTEKNEVEKILEEAKKCDWNISSVEKKERKQSARPPFMTSTIQQASWQKLHFSAKKTMMVAQQLYEGINLKKEGGSTGLITYMRTDSLNISEDALKQTQTYLKENLGKDYSLPAPRRFKTKSKGAQEAHEAIRPVSVNLSPESIKSDLTSDQYKLYKLVWERFVASQMPDAIFDNTTINIETKNTTEKYLFCGKGSILKFDGFLKIYKIETEQKILPDLSENDKITAKEIKKEDHQTQPPPRYNDASLVKILEKHGVGRPSTYAQIISTIEGRNYVERNEAKRLIPTEIGEKVNDIMTKHFKDIVDIDFTAEMENSLDKIADGEVEKLPVIRDFYGPFNDNLQKKYETVEKQELTEKTDEVCDKCGKPMVVKFGRFGKFIACSGFPDCKNTKQLPSASLKIKCPFCKTGDVIQRKTKRKRVFFGCSAWPDCEFATWQKPTGELCPECQSPLVETPKKGIKCSSKLCGYGEAEKEKKTEE
ncbi:MAG: type I DNA topoisomerase [Candidatus Marinimicrobia bacterium]|nr:type I DNA topoisomerase [Candidatus Neomarinimicrobiota bacterium]